MKKSLVLSALVNCAQLTRETSPAFFYYPDLTAYLALRSTAQRLFGSQSFEYSFLDSFVKEFFSGGFVGPLLPEVATI